MSGIEGFAGQTNTSQVSNWLQGLVGYDYEG